MHWAGCEGGGGGAGGSSVAGSVANWEEAAMATIGGRQRASQDERGRRPQEKHNNATNTRIHTNKLTCRAGHNWWGSGKRMWMGYVAGMGTGMVARRLVLSQGLAPASSNKERGKIVHVISFKCVLQEGYSRKPFRHPPSPTSQPICPPLPPLLVIWKVCNVVVVDATLLLLFYFAFAVLPSHTAYPAGETGNFGQVNGKGKCPENPTYCI